MTQLKGIDVYHGDFPLDFHAMKDAGMAFAFIKASQAINSVDPHFADNYQRAKSVGLVAGAYHFFTPFGDPVLQAKHFLQAAPLVSGDLVHCLDIETDGPNVGRDAFACAQFIKSITGRWPIIYSGDSFFQDRLKLHFDPAMHTLWIARYGPHAPVTPCSFWQFTDSARIPGNPPIDSSIFYGGTDELKSHCIA